MAVLNALSVEYQVADQRIFGGEQRCNPLCVGTTLRPYQDEAVVAAVASEMGTLRMPTGSGKTLVACAIISRLSRPALFLVTRRDLLYQAIGSFREHLFYGEAEVDEEDGPSEDLKAMRGERHLIQNVLAGISVVIMDEVQHIAANTCLTVMERCRNAKFRYGLSATDWREDGADMLIEGAVGPRVVDVCMTDLIKWGYLVAPRITTHLMAQHHEGWEYEGPTNWHSVYRHFHIENTSFHEQVADIVQRWLAMQRSILTLVISIQHGKTLERIYHEKGIPAVFLSGISSTQRRAEVLRDVRNGKLRNLIATSIADEGLDLPCLDALVLAGGGKSSTRALQRIGRVLRPAPGKTEGLVAEFFCPDHDWLKEQYRKRKAIYESEHAFILE